MRVVVDAGPVIHLSWIGHLDLLAQLFGEVLLPPAVRDEVLAPPPGTLGLDRIQRAFAQGWLQVRASTAGSSLGLATAGSLAAGEVEALTLAEESEADLVLTDDAAARVVARRHGLDTMGTVGILIEARERGLVHTVVPLLLELRRLGQWLSEDLVQAMQQEEGGPSR